MRIGIVTGEYPPMRGGVGAYTRILAQHLSRHGHSLHIFSDVQAKSDTFPIQSPSSGWGIDSLWQIRQWANSNRLDILSLQFQTAAYGMSPWIHFLPDIVCTCPVVTTFHDLRFPYLFPKAGPLRDWIVMRLASRSAGVIVTNHEDAQRVQHLPSRCLIPIGSNILDTLPGENEAQQWREKTGAESDEFLLAYFGLINRSKGLETLLESLSGLRNASIPARLLIIGGSAGSSDPTNASYIHEIETLIAHHNLDDYVHRTGFLDEAEVAAALHASDAIVLPFNDGASFRRGSLMAAIHFGRAIVTTVPRVHIPEFVHGQNMLLVPPQNADALTDTLRQLYNDPEIRQHLQQNASALAKRFDWQKIASDYLEFFETVAGSTQ